ncbi:phosphoesterase [Salipaludibacillus neizhouensis]|uniref:Phosphoesterase n=1 Tax=Salipaludibacillus neizhouensis TaxID=885475 RepID=A0A3A9KF23_9BACI|nr:phosphoesterase [Salipaludibacillus neizhouensis]
MKGGPRLKTSRKKLVTIGAALTSIVCFSYEQNNRISSSEITIKSEKLPQSFDNFNIVQLSDLHNKSFRKNHSKLVKKVIHANPNIILFTGDLVDKRSYRPEISLILMKKLVKIAPVYYVTGNHEWATGHFHEFENSLINLGVHVLRNTYKELVVGDEIIHLLGIDDPSSLAEPIRERQSTGETLRTLFKEIDNKSSYKILLSHRPEFLSLYAQFDIDLIFSGHAHGGQFRFPVLGGLFAPHQGFLPRYTSGINIEKNSTLIVNRGLGNSLFPQRIFNRPEIIVTKLSVMR